MGFFSDFFEGKTKKESTLNPQQQAVNSTLGSRLNALIASGPSPYTGQLSEDISQPELDAISRFNALNQQSQQQLGNLINFDEEAFRNQFQEEIAQPTFRTFREEVAPLLTESLSGFGTQRANVLSRAANTLQNDLLQQRFTSREAALDRSLGAIASGREQSAADVGINAIPREIRQAGLDREFQRFVEANQRYGDDINRALSFLGITTQAISQGPSTLEKIIALTEAAQGIGDVASGFGSGGTSKALTASSVTPIS